MKEITKSDWIKYFPLASPRAEQENIINFVLNSFFVEDKDNVIVEAGTGQGKSAIAMTVANYFADHSFDLDNLTKDPAIDYNVGTYVLTSQKVLQDQYIKDFSSSPCNLLTLQSSTNFKCTGIPGNTCAVSMRIYAALNDRFPKGPRDHCRRNCPYKKAKQEFIEAFNGTTNYAYFLAETMYAKKLVPRSLLVMDEAHGIEAQLSKFIEVKITEKFCKNILDLKWSTAKTVDEIYKWVSKKYEPAVKKRISKLTQDLVDENLDDQIKLTLSSQLELLDKHICKIHRMIETWDPTNWIVNISSDKTTSSFEFKPVDIAPWSYDMLFKNGQKKLFMSATILDHEYFKKSLGLDPQRTSSIFVDSTFKPENKPLIYVPVGRMSYGKIDSTLSKMSAMIEELLDTHKTEKGLIHTINFKIAEYIANTVKNKRLLVQTPGVDRMALLNSHIESNEPTVLVAPSMLEGIDLRDDLSRFQIFCKVPYPPLGDEVVKRKMAKSDDYYPYTTAQSIIQAVGRSIRSQDDYAVTYFLDECFSDYFKKNKKYFPKSFLDAVIAVGGNRMI